MSLAGRSIGATVTAALMMLALWAPNAMATFHLMQVREVYPGSVANPDSEYVELQMYASGQEFVAGHIVRAYSATGAVTGEDVFSADVAHGANQSTILIATPQAEAQFGVEADGAMSSPGQLDPGGGAVCWEAIDCVSWGTFSGSLFSPAGSPAVPSGIPDGMALRRTIAPGCATLLEAADDRDNSALDFQVVFPGPRPNSVAPTEHPCTSQPGGGAGGEGQPSGAYAAAPQTRITRAPGHVTADRTPTFRFAASVGGAGFACKTDRGRFHACRSPFTAKRLPVGRHVFRVQARMPGGLADPSPALYRFRIRR